MAPSLVIRIVGDTAGLERAFLKANRQAQGLGANMDRSFGRAKGAAAGLTGALGGLSIGFGQLLKGVVEVELIAKAFEGLSEAVHVGIEEFRDNSRIQAQMDAVLKSTGSIAGVTADHIHDLSISLSNLSGQSDEAIRAADNVLLAFTNIRNSAGEGNDIFDQATKAIVDFSARTGRDAPAAALLLGKALQDPAQRLGSLARAGITFSKSQVAMFKSVEKNQGILAAQKLLLADLEKRYGGAAAAAGTGLTGALSVLKERFKDLAGEGVSVLAPALTKAAEALAGFAVKLSEATGIHAKLTVVFDGLENLGRDLFDAVRSKISAINWSAVASAAGQGIATAAKDLVAFWRREVTTIAAGVKLAFDKIGDAFQKIDWSAFVQRAEAGIAAAGHELGVLLVKALDGLTAALKLVDWGKVGKAVADGLALAVAAAVTFLKAVDWGKVAKSLLTLLGAAVNAQQQLFLGIGKEVGRFVLDGINAGLTAAGQELEKLALEIALKIVEPFTHIPSIKGFGPGSPFQALKESMEATLAGLEVSGAAGGKKVGEAIVSGLKDGIPAGVVGPAITKALPVAAPPGLGGLSLPIAPDLLGTATKRKGITATQRNTFFDNAISRMLDRVQDIPDIKGQIAQLAAIGALITQRIAATKDVTRRLTLEDTLLQEVTRPLAADKAQLGQDFLDALSFNVDTAGATATLTDNLATEEALVAGIQKEIAQTGDIVKYRSQLLAAQEAVVATKHDMGQEMLDALTFGVDKAAVSGSFAKQFDANTALQQGIRTLIAQEGATLELQRQLFDAQQNRIAIAVARTQQIADRRRAAEEAAQKEADERNAAAEKGAQQTRDFIASNREKAQKARDRALELLTFGVTKAGVTASFKDDIATNEALRAGILAQIRGGHKTQALVEELFAVNQTIGQTRLRARDAAQFKTLGLGPTGGELAPAQADLKKQLGTVAQAVSGTFLDTSKTRGILAHVRTLLKGGLGSLSDEVRTALKKILDDTDNQLKNHSGDSKMRHVSAKNILAGVGLTPEQIRALSPRIAAIGPGGTIPARTNQLSAAGGGTTYILNNPTFRGVTDPRQLEEQLQKRARSRAVSRRGAR